MSVDQKHQDIGPCFGIAVYEQDATPLFDMWALGVTAYRLMAGKLPYEQSSHSEREKAIKNNNRDPLPAIYS